MKTVVVVVVVVVHFPERLHQTRLPLVVPVPIVLPS
jgi:hypothetical protein